MEEFPASGETCRLVAAECLKSGAGEIELSRGRRRIQLTTVKVGKERLKPKVGVCRPVFPTAIRPRQSASFSGLRIAPLL